MASTRNKNTPGDYCLQQRQNTQTEQYTLYEHSMYGSAYDTNLPGNGLGGSQMPWNKLSSNAPDIESFLFGIGSTNLVNPLPCLTPDLTLIQPINIYNKPKTLIPEPLIIEKRQRPLLH